LFNHRGSKDDSYIQLKDEKKFGQVEDMVFIADKSAAILLIQKFEKRDLLTEVGIKILFPINQFPVKATNAFYSVVLKDTSYLCKIVRSDLTLKKTKKKDDEDQSVPELPYSFFSIRPNPWFHF
jgi:hypothetical protein